MRAVVTRVTEADVRVDGAEVARIGAGLLVLLGVAEGDGEEDAAALARKIANLRIFPDDHRPLNRSILDVGGEVLVVSQFTLLADTSRGRRPSFIRSAPPEIAEPLCSVFAAAIEGLGLPVRTGRFGASMRVGSVNDGPVTIVLSTGAEDSI
jgi:D-tyrosyl-tRNA(Tyr) deacylase